MFPGVSRSNVLIVGGGVAGYNAAQIAVGLQANVTILEINEERIRFLDQNLNHKVQILKSNSHNLEKTITTADLVISTILIPGAKTPKIITNAMVKSMKPGSVIIDITIDQGGSVEPITNSTTHDNPTFIKDNIILSAVANIPGAVPQTSTIALTNATLPYFLLIANNGLKIAINKKPELLKGINCYDGKLVLKSVANALNLEFQILDLLNI